MVCCLFMFISMYLYNAVNSDHMQVSTYIFLNLPFGSFKSENYISVLSRLNLFYVVIESVLSFNILTYDKLQGYRG
jgi:hypothetical protein